MSIITPIIIGVILSVCESSASESVPITDQLGDFPQLGLSSFSESFRMLPKQGKDTATTSIGNTSVKHAQKTLSELIQEQKKLFQETSMAIRGLITLTQLSSLPEEALGTLSARLFEYEKNILYSQSDFDGAAKNLDKFNTDLDNNKKMSPEGYKVARFLLEKNKVDFAEISKNRQMIIEELSAFATLVRTWQNDYNQLKQIDSDAANSDLREKLGKYLKTVPFLY